MKKKIIAAILTLALFASACAMVPSAKAKDTKGQLIAGTQSDWPIYNDNNTSDRG